MQLAMYKGPATEPLHKIGHAATCLATWSIYSHCELVFGDTLANGHSLCASSSMRDKGVRFKHINLGTGRWDVYELPGFDRAAVAYAYDWFIKHQGLPYDYLGLAWFVLPIDAFNDPARYVCSEAIAAALRLDKPHKFHPQRLLDVAVKA